ncbi:hypothetical protein CCY01nite_06470 [Chitinophaga cymbidii]|uniref:RES domain-containing protein n=2 Tax=Chitinophaga cymbidii TaxID=1096750 RepID=A0A512RF93_9BACT|nr:hypothetical protein CCY01nite_06470 [Chitinophaga cymbidii]
MENHGYKTAEDVPETLKIVEISVPEKSILELLPKDIPGWRDKPHNEQVRDYVDGLLKKREWFLIKLPSTEMPGEFLHIINTRHPLMAEVEILGKAESSYPD